MVSRFVNKVKPNVNHLCSDWYQCSLRQVKMYYCPAKVQYSKLTYLNVHTLWSLGEFGWNDGTERALKLKQRMQPESLIQPGSHYGSYWCEWRWKWRCQRCRRRKRTLRKKRKPEMFGLWWWCCWLLSFWGRMLKCGYVGVAWLRDPGSPLWSGRMEVYESASEMMWPEILEEETDQKSGMFGWGWCCSLKESEET